MTAPVHPRQGEGVAEAVELLREEIDGYRVAAEIERGVMWSLAPYVERFHANDRDPRVTRMVRENSSSRSNEQRMTRLANATETVLSALSSQAEALEAMAGALSELQDVFAHEGEDSISRFERLADMFRKNTGYLAPGKDPGMSSCQPDGEELRAIYDAWFVAKVTRARTALSQYRQTKEDTA